MKTYNLNLLYYLQLLIEEQHVSKAAKKAGLTQPAMSHALKELRLLLKDPVLIPHKNGYTTTEKAKKIYTSIKEAITILDRALMDNKFDPTQQSARFKLMMTDYAGFIFLPQIMKTLEKYPLITLEILPWKNLNTVKNDYFDFAIGFEQNFKSSSIKKTHLFDEHYVGLCHEHHPRIQQHITLEEFLRENHMIVSEESGAIGVVNTALEKLNLKQKRKIKLEIAHFLLFPFIVGNTEMIITTTSRNADLFLNKLPIKKFPLPFKIPKIAVNLYHSTRIETNAPHQWLKLHLLQLIE